MVLSFKLIPYPDQSTVINGHWIILQKPQVIILGEAVEIIEIPNAAGRGALFQQGVKFGVTGAGVATAIVEWPVEAEGAAWLQHLANSPE